MLKFLSFARLWILAIPLALNFTGALSNQLVIAANHDTFPVMVNARLLKKLEERSQKPDIFQSLGSLIGLDIKPQEQEPFDGMLDDVHCVMTDSTHLNFLADWIDLKDAIYSPGDMLLMLGDYLSAFAFPAWFALVLMDYRRAAVK